MRSVAWGRLWGSIKSKIPKQRFSLKRCWRAFIGFIQLVAVVVTAVFAVVQIHDLRRMKSAELMLDFDKQLREGRRTQLITTIEQKKAILIENGGEFNTVELDSLLGVYELINQTFESKLLDQAMLSTAFSFSIRQAYENAEIQDYLRRSREIDGNELFAGFSALGEKIIEADRSES